MKIRRHLLLSLGIASALSLSACGSKQTDMENEALRQQVDQLEQQIQELEQKITSGSENTPEAAPEAPEEPAQDSTASSAPAAEDPAPSDSGSSLSTTRTLEELTDLVAAYEEKVNAASSTGSASDDMEAFFSLKQEEETIDDALDRHEDELEYLYRNGSLSRDEYRPLEREVERLEDRLDAAEDTLEYIYGIDD